MKWIGNLRTAMVFLLALCLLLTSCTVKSSGGGNAWQEQYDLGVRYLSEGNYEEAVIAFTAAIEIDPNQVDAYRWLADAYLALGEYDLAAAVWENAAAGQEADEALLAEFQRQGDRYMEIRTALENGETGIWITGLSFDQEGFLTGEETLFRLTALYSAPQSGDYEISVSSNIEEPFSWNRVTSAETGGGVGVQMLEVPVAPVQWDSVYWGLRADLWPVIDGSRDSLGSDTIYLTTEGEISEAAAPVNAYGATEFTSRQQYLPLKDFTAEEQAFINAVATAAVSGNLASIQNLLGFEFETAVNHSQDHFFTIWEDYKVEIFGGVYVDDEGDERKSFTIQMRPENGNGYYVSVTSTEKVDLSMETEDSWFDYSRTATITSCPCVDWQWNGEFQSSEWHEYFWRNTVGTKDLVTFDSQTTGTIVYGLKEGIEIKTERVTNDWTPGTGGPDDVLDSDETNTYTRVFRNGIIVEDNGEPLVSEGNYHTIGGAMSYSDEQSFLDARYW